MTGRSVGCRIRSSVWLVLAGLTLCTPAGAASRVRPLVVSPYLRGYTGAVPGRARGLNSNRRGYARNNRRAPGRSAAGLANSNRGNPARTQNNFRRDVAVDLDTALPALQERHPALTGKLPPDIRRFDARALRVVNQLPKVAQYSYLSTLEEYDTLSPDEQSRVGKLIRGLAGLGSHEPDFLAAASRTFSTLGSSAASTPHETCFKLQDEIDHVTGAPTSAR